MIHQTKFTKSNLSWPIATVNAVLLALALTATGTAQDAVVIKQQDMLQTQWDEVSSFFHRVTYDLHFSYGMIPSPFGSHTLTPGPLDEHGDQIWFQTASVIAQGFDGQLLGVVGNFPIKRMRELGRTELDPETTAIYLVDTAENGKFSRRLYVLTMYKYPGFEFYALEVGFSEEIWSFMYMKRPYLELFALGEL